MKKWQNCFSNIIKYALYLLFCYCLSSEFKIGTVALQLNKCSAIMMQVVIAFTLQSLENLVHVIIPSIITRYRNDPRFLDR